MAAARCSCATTSRTIPTSRPGDADLWHDVVTTGFTDIVFSFDWAVDGGADSENSDLLFAGFRVRATGVFTELARFPLGGPESLWTSESFVLPAEAADQPQIQIRFWGDVNNNNEGARIDNVVVTGLVLAEP